MRNSPLPVEKKTEMTQFEDGSHKPLLDLLPLLRSPLPRSLVPSKPALFLPSPLTAPTVSLFRFTLKSTPSIIFHSVSFYFKIRNTYYVWTHHRIRRKLTNYPFSNSKSLERSELILLKAFSFLFLFCSVSFFFSFFSFLSVLNRAYYFAPNFRFYFFSYL